MTSPGGQVLELNVGGVLYTTSSSSLGPLQARLEDPSLPRDAKGRLFLDRDGVLFRYILDYLRSGSIVLPDCFREKERLRREALHYGLQSMADSLSSLAKTSGYITIGYRGSFQFGRDGLTDVKFRKISRILVCGRVALCRTVFGESLNESRDPDHGCSDRYTARFFLKHSSIEQAFDQLQENGFRMTGSCGSGTAGIAAADLKPGVDQEENRWNHYNEFVFVRD
ncbi:BTB/POZ domain-containing protein KCTD12 [Cimex lectularius]|uniref:BTB/POZ domain-containing protein KCTD16 n=1 Tax=Cimex lectularius TaxID=79782 RepID=A0A8I6RWR3_CIMLE|nr:BTB/POZ domain-containing protein KCTD12 [Cimex lectularius]